MLSACRHFIITDWRGVFCQHSRFAFPLTGSFLPLMFSVVRGVAVNTQDCRCQHVIAEHLSPVGEPFILTSARCSLFSIDGSATGKTSSLPRGSSADSLSHPVSVPGHNQAAVAVFSAGFPVFAFMSVAISLSSGMNSTR